MNKLQSKQCKWVNSICSTLQFQYSAVQMTSQTPLTHWGA